MIHIYCGDNKGKTTCAMGLALRSAGRGNRVVICQFMKSDNSGERLAFERFENVTLLPIAKTMKFVFHMTQEEKDALRAEMNELFDLATGYVRRGEYASLNALLPDAETHNIRSAGHFPMETHSKALRDYLRGWIRYNAGGIV